MEIVAPPKWRIQMDGCHPIVPDGWLSMVASLSFLVESSLHMKVKQFGR